MATTASFELDNREMIAVINDINGRIPRAAARAVNRAAKSARTAMVKVIREDVGGIKAEDVRDAIRIVEAAPDPDPAAKILTPKRRLMLIKFGGTQLKRAGWRSRLRGGTKTIPGAFKAKLKSGHVGVFKRKEYPDTERRDEKTGHGLRIRELSGPSLAKPFVTHWRRVGAPRYREQLEKNLRSELRFARRGR